MEVRCGDSWVSGSPWYYTCSMTKPPQTQTEFVLYTALDGVVKLEVSVQDETLWLSQKMMAELFGVDVRTVNEHLQNIYKTQELVEKATIRDFRIVQKEGSREVTRQVAFYNLDAIIAVGYRVNSTRATQFRIWATEVLREYILKGFVLNDNQLKPKPNECTRLSTKLSQLSQILTNWLPKLSSRKSKNGSNSS